MTLAGDLRPRHGDALIIVDLQNDFLPGGNLAVANGDAVIAPLNQYIDMFAKDRLPVIATRDWHPPDHCSFVAQGGIWPPHCIAGTRGAQFAGSIALPERAIIVSKADRQDKDAYSGFEGTDLANRLRELEVKRLFVGGLATDYCVLNTVLDGLDNGFEVLLLQDAIRAVNVQPADGQKAVESMKEKGAIPVELAALAA